MDFDTLQAGSPIHARSPPEETGPTTSIEFVDGNLDVEDLGTAENRLDPGLQPEPVEAGSVG